LKAIKGVLFVLLFFILPVTTVIAQSTSSKGTEFWTCYMDHIAGTTGSTGSQMILYITSDVATSGTVSFTDGTASIPYNVTPNTVTFVTIPASQFLGTEGQFKKGIHIVALKPIAVYAHIYASSVSGATLLLPVNTMGKNYISLNYTQLSNSGTSNPSYSTFAVIATEDDTQVEIVPSAKLVSGKAAGAPFVISLNKGELYQGLSATDLTGTKIHSVSTTGACKKIAVFSGSSKIGIGCFNSANDANSQSLSSDNLFQQVYPTSTWGKNYVTVPLKSRNYDVYRIVLSDPNTNVSLNGNTIANTAFTNGLYYEFSTTGTTATNVISADKPIQVVQYTATQNQNKCNPTTTAAEPGGGDPEMIYLSPIEQGLDHVTLYSTGYYKILNSYINIVLLTSAVPTFTLDDVSYSSSFKPVNGNPAYSYAQIAVSSGPQSPLTTGTAAGTHNIKATSPFNAIAYGFGATESYGYAAGTNLVNLNENIALQNTNGTVSETTTSGCINNVYKLRMTLPYKTTNIKWDLKDGTPPIVDAAPVIKSTTMKGTETLYTYEYAGSVTYTKPGDYSVVATVFNPIDDECGSSRDIQFDFNISDFPVADFIKTDNCLGAETTFTDKSANKNTRIKSWLWKFGDGATSTDDNSKHTYTKTGDFPVTLTIINDNGCSSTSAIQTVHISPLPVPAFDYGKLDCAKQDILFTDQSTTTEGTITKWTWDFGDGTAAVSKIDKTPFTHAFAIAGTYDIKLTITTVAGCTNTLIKTIVVNPSPQVNFTLPTVCLVNSTAQFNDATPAIAGKTFTYLWDFNDTQAGKTLTPATGASTIHQFTAAGTYHISLTVTTSDGCAVTITKDYVVTGLAKFTAPTTACPNDPIVFTDQTDATKTAATAWHWNFDDNNTTADIQNPTHAFATPGDHNVTLTVTGNNGCSQTTYSQKIHITASPIAAFIFPASPLCEKKPVVFTDASTSAESAISKWIWDFGDGSTPETYSSKNAFTHTFTNTGTYTIKLKVVTISGCESAILQKSITINPLPIVDFTLPDACLDDYVKFYDKSSIADHTETAFTYLWNFGDANANAANPNTSTAKDPQHHYSAAGVYKITLTVTSKYGCEFVSAQKDFTVNGSAPTANFNTVSGGTAFCSVDDVLITNKAHVGFGRITQVKMFWDWAGDQNNFTLYTGTAAIEGAIFKHNYGINNVAGQTKTYQLRMIAYSGSSLSCTAVSAVQTITVRPNPLITVTAPSPVCQEQDPFKIQTNLNGFTGTGVFSGTGVSADGTFNPAKAGPGTFTLNYTFTDNNTCGYTTTVAVTVYPTPKVYAGADVTLLEGGDIKLSGAAASPQPLTYKWTLMNGNKAIGLDHDDVLYPTASPTNTTTYMLTATSVNGCTASSKITVNVLKLPVVPNTFTPNGDGVNDKWEIKYLETYDGATVEIYDRSGSQLFLSNGYSAAWDGNYKGQPLPTGTYYYIINPKHGRKALSGSVTIIR